MKRYLMREIKANDIISHFYSYAEQNWPKDTNSNSDIEESIYFISMMPRKYPTLGDVTKQFRLFYIELMKNVLGHNIHSKIKYQPLTYAFIDFAASRDRRYIIPEARNEWPHIHALMSVNPIIAKRTEEALMDPEFILNTRSSAYFNTPDIRKYDSKEGSLEDLTSYCMKGSMLLNRNTMGEDHEYDIYPEKEVHGRSRR